MFRDRTVFKALLDDFTACLRHGSHGTLGSIKHQTNYRHQCVFSLLNPVILVQSRALREIQPLSMPIVSLLSVLRSVLTARPAALSPSPGRNAPRGRGARAGPVTLPSLAPAPALSMARAPGALERSPANPSLGCCLCCPAGAASTAWQAVLLLPFPVPLLSRCQFVVLELLLQ